MPFKKGECGNPSGRPKGAKGKITERARALLKNKAEEITQKCIDLALQGDIQAIKILMDRILPVKKELEIQPPEDGAVKITFELVDAKK